MVMRAAPSVSTASWTTWSARISPTMAWSTTAGSLVAAQKPPDRFRAASSAYFIRINAACFSSLPMR